MSQARALFVKRLCAGLACIWCIGAGAQMPVINVSVAGGQSIDDAPRPCAVVLVHGQDSFSANGRIHIRGASSRSFPKHSYTLVLDSALALLAGQPAQKKWVLYALWLDRSYIRALLAQTLARDTRAGAPHAMLTQCTIAGRPQGIYGITQSIRAPDSNTIVFKIDKQNKNERHIWTSAQDTNVFALAHHPGPKHLPAATRNALSMQLSALDSALASADFQDAQNGWRAYLDEATTIDYILLMEWLRPVDAYRSSAYFYWRPGEKIKPGPLWDMDQSMGNSKLYGAARTDGWQWASSARCAHCRPDMPRWWQRLTMEDTTLRHALARRWQALRSGPFSDVRVNALIDSLMPPPDMRAADVQAWGTQPARRLSAMVAYRTYRAEVSALRKFLRQRAAWLDAALNLSNAATGEK